ncbi:chemotaxis protein CheW [Mesorhizobium sp. SP-1A]|uniref:chemotaxis protein CheW n=1 Tax=Mesorhizobium sp. SP-1A TaxID=3077840 RepID=UPI0028F73AC9|nr:chemotaxis protein CheW [Mesorhizobium sp. SP-1A]
MSIYTAEGANSPLSLDDDAGAVVKELVVFHSLDNRWAVETRYVTGVRLGQTITPLPGSERHVLGLVDLLGTIVPVFCLSELLGLDRDATGTGMCNLVILGEHRTEFALQFTGRSSFVKVSDELITYGSPATFPEPNWVVGLLKDGTTVLDGRAILDDRSFTVGH